jgi:hypothetical protein
MLIMTFHSIYLPYFQIYSSSEVRNVTIWEYQILQPTHYFFPLCWFQTKWLGPLSINSSLGRLQI